ncbi:HAD-IC family P-type ATPase [Pseudochelatococcus contaminans]|uniref:Magnesium-transporting ATPase (P-type) n=1 Tax=Pseudochelatococcus contaminans TaxID=1538103 RepID=A0A7W5Z4S8_9HYPH|nr:HAD-IC family P-type ATPase [Pseudochelatococcus contaminans]MBB3809984.1 magnesium-transporting ATPase (P-type) [Pseudochelatococcus contaminans]
MTASQPAPHTAPSSPVLSASQVQPAWHALPADEARERLAVGEAGLDEAEVAARRVSFGPNALPPPPRRHPLLRFLLQFHNTLIYVLLGGAVAALVLGHIIDAAVILAVVVVNAIVGFVQEGKAEAALSAIRDMISPHANVIRAGRRTNIPAQDIVPGDIVLLEAGDRVPADLRLIHARNLLIDEAILTGESVAAEKHDAAVAEDAPLGDRCGMAFSGTMVAAGQGAGIAVATASQTEIGHIQSLLADVEPMSTPLLRQIDAFARRFTIWALAAAVALFIFAVAARDYGWADALIAVVALAVGVVPEGLPAVMTITLAIGVRRMVARNAVIRRLPAVETLGATSVICSDKTGTLTRNEMTVTRIVSSAGLLRVSGASYNPDAGAISGPDGAAITVRDDDASTAALIISAATLCNDASLRPRDHHARDGQWIVDGDPMEGALLTLAHKAQVDPDGWRSAWPRRDVIPFDSVYRWMATLHAAPDGDGVIFVKGAPERLLEMCAVQQGENGIEPLDMAYWRAAIDAAADDGERILGYAMRHLPSAAARLEPDDLREGLIFLGLTGFIDPPRDEAIAAIRECHAAGITVKMITGDHGATARAIARQLGLSQTPVVALGADIDRLADGDLPAFATRTDVFARTSPEHKLRIVKALQSTGAVVAMTGDGVNDAPSLRQADVGIAMGRKGTEAAKEAAQVVLLDDNFASIVAAVSEGRTVYDNIRKMIAWTLPTNGGELLAVVAAIIMGFTMPLTPAQILWLNLITAATLGLVLAFEPAEPGVMSRRPREAHAPLLSPFMLWRVLFVSVLFLIALMTVFFFSATRGDELALSRTLCVNTLVVLEIFYLFNVRYLNSSSFTWRGALGTPSVLAAIAAVTAGQMLFTYAPFMQIAFDTRPVSLADGALLIALGVIMMIVLEIEKAILRRLGLFGLK